VFEIHHSVSLFYQFYEGAIAYIILAFRNLNVEDFNHNKIMIRVYQVG
jgi:hypothetical protein